MANGEARVIRQTIALIEDEAHWTRDTALDADGEPVLPTMPWAVRWNLRGALFRAAEGSFFFGPTWDLLQSLTPGGAKLYPWSQQASHREVMALLLKALAAANTTEQDAATVERG